MKLNELRAALRRDWIMLALALPGVLVFLLFAYLPLLGNIIAFQDYLPFLGVSRSPWVGWDNFTMMFEDPAFIKAVVNTLLITGIQLILFFPIPIMLALLIHSIMSPGLRRLIQSVVYLPHFLSWVIIIAIFQQMFGETSGASEVFGAIGLGDFKPMTDPDFFPWLVSIQLIWRDAGWGTIIFLAALLSIDDSLYEAAAVDGAGKWKRMWHITLPSLLPITIVLLILRLGSALTVGFEQILLQRDAVGANASEVLDTYVYFQGVVGGQWGISAAAGLIKGIVGTLLVIAADRAAKAMGQQGIYST